MVLLFLLLCTFVNIVVSIGRSKFECPDGYYLSNFGSIFGNGKRMYDFGCSAISKGQIVQEKCGESVLVANTIGDMYLSCNSTSQYVVGVTVTDVGDYQSWKLQCCQSEDLQVDLNSCVSTPLLNEYQQSFFAFDSGSKHIVKNLQSIYDDLKKDRKWWIQTCPFRTSFLPVDENPQNLETSTLFLLKQAKSFGINKKFDAPMAYDEEKKTKVGTNMERKVFKSADAPAVTRLFQTTVSSVLGSADSRTSSITIDHVSSSSESHKLPYPKVNDDVYADYYDPDGSIRREKSVDQSSDPALGGIFKNLHKVFKAIQDGLVFVQFAFENEKDLIPNVPVNKQKEQKKSSANANGFNSDPQLKLQLDEFAEKYITEETKSILHNVVDYFGLCQRKEDNNKSKAKKNELEI